MTPDQLRAALVVLPDRDWLCGALVRVGEEPRTVAGFYGDVGRRCGRRALPGAPGWTADVAARVLLLTVLPLSGSALTEAITPLYQFGDTTERFAVLRALPMLDLGTSAIRLTRDAITGSNPRLLAAAMGTYSRHLDDEEWREGVLRCVRMGVPLGTVHGLHKRADPQLADILAAHIDKRRAAKLHVSADAVSLLRSLSVATGTGR